LTELNTTTAVNHALGKLFSLVAENRIPARNAAVLAYIGQLLLNSIAEVRGEVYAVDGRVAEMELVKTALDILNMRPNRGPANPA
jgi:hypothetical protein